MTFNPVKTRKRMSNVLVFPTYYNKAAPKLRSEAHHWLGETKPLPSLLNLFTNICANWLHIGCLYTHECLPQNCSLVPVHGVQENAIASNNLVKLLNYSLIWQLHSVFICETINFSYYWIYSAHLEELFITKHIIYGNF